MTDNVKDFEAGKEKQADGDAEGGKGKVTEQLDKAREKFTEVAGEVEKKAKAIGGSAGKATQQVKESAGKATQQVKESAEKASVAAKEKYGVAREKVIVGYDKARKDMDTLVEDVNEYTRDNPGKAVLIAAGVGFLLGMLIRPRRHD